MTPPDHYYVYHQLLDGQWYYERTCATRDGAEDRVHELEARQNGRRAMYLHNVTLLGAFY